MTPKLGSWCYSVARGGEKKPRRLRVATGAATERGRSGRGEERRAGVAEHRDADDISGTGVGGGVDAGTEPTGEGGEREPEGVAGCAVHQATGEPNRAIADFEVGGVGGRVGVGGATGVVRPGTGRQRVGGVAGRVGEGGERDRHEGAGGGRREHGGVVVGEHGGVAVEGCERAGGHVRRTVADEGGDFGGGHQGHRTEVPASAERGTAGRRRIGDRGRGEVGDREEVGGGEVGGDRGRVGDDGGDRGRRASGGTAGGSGHCGRFGPGGSGWRCVRRTGGASAGGVPKSCAVKSGGWIVRVSQGLRVSSRKGRFRGQNAQNVPDLTEIK